MPASTSYDNFDPPSETGKTGFDAIRTLRLLFVGTIVLPLLLGTIGAYLSYRASYRSAADALAEAVAVAEENTTKVLDTHVLVADRIDDLLAGLSDAQIRINEQKLHDRMSQQIADLPEVVAAWVIGADRRELVSARVYPVNDNLDQSGREDLKALQDSRNKTFVWALRARSLNGGEFQPYFTVSRRRQSSDGSFRGIVVVAVSGEYFASFYNSLLGGSTQYTASVLREDGTTLAHYPEDASLPSTAQERSLLEQALANKATSGIVDSGGLFDMAGSLVAYQRLADYPVYVTIARTRDSILRDWVVSISGYALVGIPAAIGLALLSLVALRRTRREQEALAQARDAVTQHAAIEAQLHHAQKMEAVGLLTAGIAHDFNNLLTIVAGNIALVEAGDGKLEEDGQRLLAAAAAGCDRAAALTQRLLGFARRKPVDPQPVDVNEVITGLSDLPWRAGDRITTEVRLLGGLWPVFVDPNQLESAVLNLALNARDAMAGRGTLTIETRNHQFDDASAAEGSGVTPGDYVAILVADTGPGMPEEVREKAFDPFFTTKPEGIGTGLGLSQVYGFVTRSGGHCTIDSEPGRGTTVKLYLPRYVPKTGSGTTDGDAKSTTSPRTPEGMAPHTVVRLQQQAMTGG